MATARCQPPICAATAARWRLAVLPHPGDRPHPAISSFGSTSAERSGSQNGTPGSTPCWRPSAPRGIIGTSSSPRLFTTTATTVCGVVNCATTLASVGSPSRRGTPSWR
jgi:hypothetical protein